MYYNYLSYTSHSYRKEWPRLPRPSKHVSPDTLGGRIRAAREDLRLSLADVAGGHYSTSLISQIERNRVEPSQESLRFLAERLNLSMEDLEALAQQHRESEVEALQYKSYDDLRSEATQLLKKNEPQKALELLQNLQLVQIPPAQRWLIAALRGQCYFELRQFLHAIQDFVYAVDERPRREGLSTEQQHELMLLHLHLAACYRILGIEDALEQYQITLRMINNTTPFQYVAETHWGMALVAFLQAYKLKEDPNTCPTTLEKLFTTALEHAKNAHFLYRSINDPLQASLVTCHIMQIEKELGHKDAVQRDAYDLIELWSKGESDETLAEASRAHKEQASVLAIAYCTLAGLSLDAGKYQQALDQVKYALQTAEKSHKVRQAEAHIMHGRILEAMQHSEEAEQAFRKAVEILDTTERIAIRISAHTYLASHLMKHEKKADGEAEFTKAQELMSIVASQRTDRNDEHEENEGSSEPPAQEE
jgi:tetratricopeptide (TPR) repeat protein